MKNGIHTAAVGPDPCFNYATATRSGSPGSHNGEGIKHQVAKTDNSHVSEFEDSNRHWNYMMLVNLINFPNISATEASHCSLIDFTMHWTDSSKRRRCQN